MKKKYKRITLSDRINIQLLLGLKKNYTQIGKDLGFHKTTIRAEVKRCILGKYDALLALIIAFNKASSRKSNKTKMILFPSAVVGMA